MNLARSVMARANSNPRSFFKPLAFDPRTLLALLAD
jgi:hypothetical protein